MRCGKPCVELGLERKHECSRYMRFAGASTLWLDALDPVVLGFDRVFIQATFFFFFLTTTHWGYYNTDTFVSSRASAERTAGQDRIDTVRLSIRLSSVFWPSQRPRRGESANTGLGAGWFRLRRRRVWARAKRMCAGKTEA